MCHWNFWFKWSTCFSSFSPIRNFHTQIIVPLKFFLKINNSPCTIANVVTFLRLNYISSNLTFFFFSLWVGLMWKNWYFWTSVWILEIRAFSCGTCLNSKYHSAKNFTKKMCGPYDIFFPVALAFSYEICFLLQKLEISSCFWGQIHHHWVLFTPRNGKEIIKYKGHFSHNSL